MRLHDGVVALFVAASFGACGGSVEETAGGVGSPDAGGAGSSAIDAGPAGGPGRMTGEPGVLVHDARRCGGYVPEGHPVLRESECVADGDCSDEPHGRCVGDFHFECAPHGSVDGWNVDYERGLPCESLQYQTYVRDPDCPGQCYQLVYARCVYDECVSDSECAVDERCSCDPHRNRCVATDCHADSDCPAGERCEPFPSVCSPEIGGYACTTPQDECQPRKPCTTSDVSAGWCVFWEGFRQCIWHTCP